MSAHVEGVSHEEGCRAFAENIDREGDKNVFQIVAEHEGYTAQGRLSVRWAAEPEACAIVLTYYDGDELVLPLDCLFTLVEYINYINWPIIHWIWPNGEPSWFIFQVAHPEAQTAMMALRNMSRRKFVVETLRKDGEQRTRSLKEIYESIP
jgi:hypothetical protein